MEKLFINYMDGKNRNIAEIKNGFRNAVLEDLMNYLSERYETVRKIDNTELGFIIGCAPDNEGFSSDVCITLKPVVKNWYDKPAEKRPVRRYDLDEVAEAYERDMEIKASLKKGASK